MHEYKRQQGLNLKRQIQHLSFHPFIYCELSQWMRLKVTTSHAWENTKITLSVIGSAFMKPFRHLFQNPSSIYSPPVLLLLFISTQNKIFPLTAAQGHKGHLKDSKHLICRLVPWTVKLSKKLTQHMSDTCIWTASFFHISHKPASLVLNQKYSYTFKWHILAKWHRPACGSFRLWPRRWRIHLKIWPITIKSTVKFGPELY